MPARIVRLFAFLVLVSMMGTKAKAQGTPAVATEYGVKAAFLLNFARFVEWPASAFASPDAPFEICVLGKDPFGRLLDQVAEGETVGRRRIVVRRVAQMPPSPGCQTLFVGSGKPGSPPSKNTLVVGEGSDTFRNGGAIAFQLDEERVRFDIDQKAVESAGLKISSALLKVARVVR